MTGIELDSLWEPELDPWHGFLVSREQLEQRLRSYARQTSSVFLLRIDDGLVCVEEKSASSGDCVASGSHLAALLHRVEIYRRFLESALRIHGIRGRAVIAVHVDDLEQEPSGLPVFSFQKPRGSRNILIPDVEMLDHQFYISDVYRDTVPYEDKEDRAVFVGSTTGSHISRWVDPAEINNARVRAAMFFRGNPDVDFYLPSIVQVEDQKVIEDIINLNISGNRMSWDHQSEYKFQISIDGNGAACSRLYLAMRGNSVPLKFESLHELYFFKKLRPWRHYIPISRNEDVLTIIAEAKDHHQTYASVSLRSTEFVRAHLTRIPVIRYMADLIYQYMVMFGEDAFRKEVDAFVIDSVGHFSDIGTMAGEPSNWLMAGPGNRLEGFRLEAAPEIDPSDLSYNGIECDGSPLPGRHGDEYSGTRGQELPLHGLQISLHGRAAERHDLFFQACFADGSSTELLPSGSRAFNSAPLSGFRIVTTQVSSKPKRWFHRARASKMGRVIVELRRRLP